jgi:hypothetical protein
MKIVKIIILVLLIGLGISSAIAKIMRMPEEVEFFSGAGLNETLLILFGIIQLIGSLLLIPKKFRKNGALILMITFLISTIFIFLSGALGFAIFSMLPIFMTLIIIKDKH